MLYKYMTSKRFLENRKIKFSRPSELAIFNDTMDCVPAAVLIEDKRRIAEEIAERNRDKKFLMNFVESGFDFDKAKELTEIHAQSYIEHCINSDESEFYLGIAKNTIDEHIAIFSLSKNHLNRVMWTHYAGGHTGYVIAFDENHEFFKERIGSSISFSMPLPVIYQDKRATILKSPGNCVKVGDNFHLIKERKWIYEEELRVIALNETGWPIGFILIDVPASAVKGIILGKEVNAEEEREMRSLIKALLPEIPIVKIRCRVDGSFETSPKFP